MGRLQRLGDIYAAVHHVMSGTVASHYSHLGAFVGGGLGGVKVPAAGSGIGGLGGG